MIDVVRIGEVYPFGELKYSGSGSPASIFCSINRIDFLTALVRLRASRNAPWASANMRPHPSCTFVFFYLHYF
jgi:hypothetical protein